MSNSTGLLKNSAFLFAAMMIANASNYLFQFFMGRALSVSDFGMMNALFSLLAITSVPAGTVQLVMAQYGARLGAENEDRLWTLYLSALKWVSLCAVVGMAGFLLVSGKIAGFLNISSVTPVVLIGAALGVGLLAPVNLGMLQGLHRFGYVGGTTILGSVSKLGLGMLLVYVGWGVYGALASLSLSSLGVLGLSAFALRALCAPAKERRSGVSGREMFSYGLPAVGASLCFMALTNMDMVLVRHYFSPEEAGMYAAAGVLGRVVLYAPGAIVLALFPMMARAHALNGNAFHLLDRGMLYAGGIAGAGAIGYALFPELFLRLLFGGKYADAAPLLRLFGVAMVPLSLMAVLMHFNLAQRRIRFLYSMVAACLLEVGLIGVYHANLHTIIWILLGVGGALCGANFGMIVWERMRNGKLPA
ncbi:MAG: oligosaccharide flippase family protein, partial [Candidatus Latescibacteria bacterium]|nr:oligosaccharide flippase family protein [Candidatus Latescibacterota bacterium]